MATSQQGSDTTESSQYPSDGTNSFVDKSPSPAEKAGEDAQSSGADTTAESQETEPVDPDRRSSTSEGPPGVDDSTDTTQEESKPSEDAPEADSEPEGEVTGDELSAQDDPSSPSEDETRATEGEDAPEGRSDESGEASPDESQGPVVQYHGTEPDGDEYEDYAFISGVDPDQRYETVEDMVNGHEELIQHSHRQRDQIESLQEKVTDLQATKEGEVEEMRAKLSVYEDQLGEDQIVDALAERHMPEEYQGLSREDVSSENEEEYLRAKWEAERKAEEELEEAQAAREEAESKAIERQERYQERVDNATEWLQSVDHERLGVDPKDEEYVREAIADLTPDEMQDEANVFDLAHMIRTAPALMPDEANIGPEKADAISEMLVDAVGAKAREQKRQAMQSRSDKIKKAQSRSGSRAPDPEPAKQESATREPGRPEQTFRKA